jgi:hypothetical protein
MTGVRSARRETAYCRNGNSHDAKKPPGARRLSHFK